MTTTGAQEVETTLWQAVDVLRSRSSIPESVSAIVGLLLIRYLEAHPVGVDYNDFGAPGTRSNVTWQEVVDDPTGQASLSAVHAFESAESSPSTSLLHELHVARLARDPVMLRRALDAVDRIPEESFRGGDLGEGIDRFIDRAVHVLAGMGGAFSIPADVAQLLVALLNLPPGATVYDPSCSDGSLLLVAAKLAEDGANGDAVVVIGQERNVGAAALAQARLLLRGVRDARIELGDSLVSPLIDPNGRLQRFDFVASCPPLGRDLRSIPEEAFSQDMYGRFRLGHRPASSDWPMIEHILAVLADRGRAVVLVSQAALSRSGHDAAIREYIVKDDLIEAVISLPPNVLIDTAAPSAILVLSKAKEDAAKGKVRFVHTDDRSARRPRSRRVLDDDQRRLITSAALQTEPITGVAVTKTLEEIAGHDFSLVPAQYIEVVNLARFLGGTVTWRELSDLADVIPGTRIDRQRDIGGTTPYVQGRDLSNTVLLRTDLEKIDLSPTVVNPVHAQVGDLLIQRIGESPRVRLVKNDLTGVLVAGTIYVVRLKAEYRYLQYYLVEFLSSPKGQTLLTARMAGAGAPTLNLGDLRNLQIPVPATETVSLVDALYLAEEHLLDRVTTARAIRQRLFNIEDPDRINSELAALRSEADVLSASLVQVRDLNFQIRNFFPFPLAYAFRLLDAIDEPAQRYQEQLRVAENILAFVGSVGLALAAYEGVLTADEESGISRQSLSGCWRNGISPGHWQQIAKQSAEALRSNSSTEFASAWASLWFKGRGSKESEFAELLGKLVKEKNDQKHNRGPKSRHAYETASRELSSRLVQALEPLAMLVAHPLRLIQGVDFDWRSETHSLKTLAYTGDHPGMKQETVVSPRALSRDHLYLHLADGEWVSLYPLISVHDCLDCKTRETYLIDSWSWPKGRNQLTSFERGHSRSNDDASLSVAEDFEIWLQRHCGT